MKKDKLFFIKSIFIFLFLIFIFTHCSTIDTIEKSFDFKKVDCIGIVTIKDFYRIPESGHIIYTAFAENLLAHDFKIVLREPKWTFLNEKEFQLNGINVHNDFPQVLLHVNIISYEIEEKKLIDYTIYDNGTTTTTTTTTKTSKPRAINKMVNGKPFVDNSIPPETSTTTETVTKKDLGKKTHSKRYVYSQAKIVLNIQMIDIKTGKVVLCTQRKEKANNIAKGIDQCVNDILSSFYDITD